MDFNDLRIFERVAALGSFSKAAQALTMPKSTVSRSVARLEESVGIRLLQRTTRDVVVTEAGRMLQERATSVVFDIEEALDLLRSLAGGPRGQLSISAGIGFGINVLSEILPEFVRRYPLVDISLDLTSREAELIQERIDVAIRMGAIVDSSLITTKLGKLPRYMCASPDYLARRGAITRPSDLSNHDCIEMPTRDGRARTWFMRKGGEAAEVQLAPKISVNEAITIYNLVRNGTGVGIVSAYLCDSDFQEGRLVRVLPDWSMPSIEVSIVYPSRRELSPTVRAFVDFLHEKTKPRPRWQGDITTSFSK